jgi:hypothetical protein
MLRDERAPRRLQTTATLHLARAGVEELCRYATVSIFPIPPGDECRVMPISRPPSLSSGPNSLLLRPAVSWPYRFQRSAAMPSPVPQPPRKDVGNEQPPLSRGGERNGSRRGRRRRPCPGP